MAIAVIVAAANGIEIYQLSNNRGGCQIPEAGLSVIATKSSAHVACCRGNDTKTATGSGAGTTTLNAQQEHT